MAEAMSDARLEVVLASVGEHLVLPPGAAVDAAPPRRHGRGRALWVAAVAVAALLVGAFTLNPVQDAVAEIADWLGIGSTRVERVGRDAPDPSGLPRVDAGLPAISPPAAAQRLGRLLPTTGLGPPDLIAAPPEGGVLLGWDRDATTLFVRPFDDEPAAYFDKLLDEYDTVREVPDLGRMAVAVRGDHVLTTPHRRLAAGSVVLWVDDGLEYRLEAETGLHRLLDVAHAIDRAN
jgi:hypothetical protein